MELANEQVDLPACQRRRQTTFEIAAQKAIGGHAEIERGSNFRWNSLCAAIEILI